MKKSELMRRLGYEDAAKRMLKTEPGRLSAMLADLIYAGDVREIQCGNGPTVMRLWSTTSKAYDYQEGAKVYKNEEKVATVQVLREIRDYLEDLAFIEVHRRQR